MRMHFSSVHVYTTQYTRKHKHTQTTRGGLRANKQMEHRERDFGGCAHDLMPVLSCWYDDDDDGGVGKWSVFCAARAGIDYADVYVYR